MIIEQLKEWGTNMRITRLIAVLLALAAVAAFTTEASAMCNPRLGVFMQRDPGPGAGLPARIGAAGPAVGGSFAKRDILHPVGSGGADLGKGSRGRVAGGPMRAGANAGSLDPTLWRQHQDRSGRARGEDVNSTGDGFGYSHWHQYDDGMSLYQYCASNPMVFVDPEGLKKCRWGGDISGNWVGGILAYGSVSVDAWGTDGSCWYHVKGYGRLVGGGTAVGWISARVGFDDYEADCQWPIEKGSGASIAFVGISTPVGNITGVQATAGQFIAHGVFDIGGINVTVGGAGWGCTLSKVTQEGPLVKRSPMP